METEENIDFFSSCLCWINISRQMAKSGNLIQQQKYWKKIWKKLKISKNWESFQDEYNTFSERVQQYNIMSK
jgi:hypothetical protein